MRQPIVWQYQCLECDYMSQLSNNRESLESYAQLHREQHKHRLILHGKVGEKPAMAKQAAAGGKLI